MSRPRQLVIPGQDLEIVNRRMKVMEMLIEHKSPMTIAKTLGERVNTIYKDKKALMLEIGEITEENRTAYRNEITEKVLTLLERWLPLATSEELSVQGEKITKKGEREIIELEAFEAGATASGITIKLLQELAKLHGAYSDAGPSESGDGRKRSGPVLNLKILQAFQTGLGTGRPVVEAQLIDETNG